MKSAFLSPRQLPIPWVSWAVAYLCLAGPARLLAADVGPPGFRFADVSDKSLGLWEGNRPVLVYNHGVMSKTGVPADRNRSTYIHPLYGLDGEVLTDDFPKDHYHHRGLFWAWPHIKIDGKEYSTWDLRGIEQRFERWLLQRTDAGRAVLGVENGWYVGDRKVMREEVWIEVQPAAKTARVIDLQLTWTPTDRPVGLGGAEAKSYGGLTLRYAPGTNTTITVPSGQTKDDLYMTRLAWADLSLKPEGRESTSGAAVFVHPSHPDYPPTWLTRHYGVLCVGWPGVVPATFQPDQAIHGRYRVWIHKGSAGVSDLRRAYEVYSRESARAWVR